jgi:Spy/CpxP family protein refolding chaperone
MNRILFFALLVASAASAVHAQPKPKTNPKGKEDPPRELGIDEPLYPLKQKEVQTELKLTAKQIQRIPELTKLADAAHKSERDQYLKAFIDAQARQKESFRAKFRYEILMDRRRIEVIIVDSVLTAEQKPRFQQLRYQMQGLYASHLVAGAWGGQVDVEAAVVKALDLSADQQNRVRLLLEVDPVDWNTVQEKFLPVLKDAQKDTWKELCGKPLGKPEAKVAAKDGDGPSPKDEEEAAKQVAAAKFLSQTGRKDQAREKLEAVLKKYGNTKAADDAAKLLDKLKHE